MHWLSRNLVASTSWNPMDLYKDCFTLTFANVVIYLLDIIDCWLSSVSCAVKLPICHSLTLNTFSFQAGLQRLLHRYVLLCSLKPSSTPSWCKLFITISPRIVTVRARIGFHFCSFHMLILSLCHLYSFKVLSALRQALIHSIGMCRMRRFLAVLRSFFHSSLLCTFFCHPSPPTILPSSLTPILPSISWSTS